MERIEGMERMLFRILDLLEPKVLINGIPTEGADAPIENCQPKFCIEMPKTEKMFRRVEKKIFGMGLKWFQGMENDHGYYEYAGKHRGFILVDHCGDLVCCSTIGNYTQEDVQTPGEFLKGCSGIVR